MQEVLNAIQRVRFTKSTLRHASTREKERTIVGRNKCQSSSSATSLRMKFDDRSHEETERQQPCARSKAWNLAKNR